MAAANPPKSPDQRRRRNTPERGEWKPTAGRGWQHGVIPDAPKGLTDASYTAWTTWMRSWFAANWLPEDLPGLRQVVLLYDLCERAADDPFIEVDTDKGTSYIRRPHPATELRQMMDNYGITPKGQQDRRWVRTTDDVKPGAKGRTRVVAAPYAALRVVND